MTFALWKMKQRDKNKSNSGKGDKPRSCFSRRFKDNYNDINWGKQKKKKKGRWKKSY